ncbi:MAG: lipopolysaccharide heptosyltransferase II [Bryobacteraceae bacterium]|nr:lipopolysaccharide heptosyltransferase II [Bryobacteraceae bacterium]
MSLPALRALRERYPHARITLLAMPWVADLYGREPFCDELIPWRAQRGPRDLAEKWRVGRALAAHRFDLAVVLPNSFDSALPAWLAGIPRRVGFDRDARGWLLTDRIPRIQPGDTPPHQSSHYLELLRRAGLIERLPTEAIIRLDGAAAAREQGRQRLGPGPIVGVCPGAAFGGAKRWAPERFATSARTVAAKLGARVALFGSKDEVAICDEVNHHLGGTAKSYAGATSLGEFVEMLAACDVVLTNDSGPMHVASALGVPTVAVFGSTDHIATGPTGPLARVVREPVACSPCFERECPLSEPAAHLACLRGVSAERVAREALQLLGVDALGVD